MDRANSIEGRDEKVIKILFLCDAYRCLTTFK